MIGLIDCRSQGAGAGWGNLTPELLEFFDRPLLQHAIDQMIVAGVTRCVLITANPTLLNDRWGCNLSVIHPQAVTGFLMEQMAKPAVRPSSRRILVGRIDCIPLLRLASIPLSTGTQLLFSERQDEGIRTRHFTGWALTDPSRLLQYCFPTQGAEGLLTVPRSDAIQAAICIRSQTPGQFLRSQQQILESFQPTGLAPATEIQPGIYAARMATLHPSANVTGPLYLAENVRIGQSVTLRGPLVVCRNSVVDMNADLEDVCVQPGVYVGKGAQRHGLIFTRSFLRAEWTLRTLPFKRSFHGGAEPESSKLPVMSQPKSFSNRSTG
jgi:hypothetical protein